MAARKAVVFQPGKELIQRAGKPPVFGRIEDGLSGFPIMTDPISQIGESATKQRLTPRQLRILHWMREGDQLFEVLGRAWRTVWDEKSGRDHRVQAGEVDELVRLGLIQKIENPFPQRLDAWALTPARTRSGAKTYCLEASPRTAREVLIGTSGNGKWHLFPDTSLASDSGKKRKPLPSGSVLGVHHGRDHRIRKTGLLQFHQVLRVNLITARGALDFGQQNLLA